MNHNDDERLNEMFSDSSVTDERRQPSIPPSTTDHVVVNVGGRHSIIPEAPQDAGEKTLYDASTAMPTGQVVVNVGGHYSVIPEAPQDTAEETLYAPSVTFTNHRDPSILPGPPTGVHAGRLVAGKYRLDMLIGSGGMGEVYRAEHMTLRMPVAVKVMHATRAASEEHTRRFYREARAVSQLNHPNVVRILDFGQDETSPYIVMEWLQGMTLFAYLRNLSAPLPLADVQDIMLQILSAFDAAHAQKIVHRDVKPENIFVTEVLGKRTVKILDFGLAHVEVSKEEDGGPTLTKSDTAAGTPEYMSPEQCRSLVVGPTSDIYSLACVLTVMLQGRPPFHGQTAIDTLSSHLFKPPPPLLRPIGTELVPPLLERLRLEMLAKQPDKRPSSIAEVRERFIAALDPNSTATEMITRKGDAPAGSRAARAPRWDAERPTLPLGKNPGQELEEISFWKFGPGGGIDESCTTGLASQGLLLVPVASIDEVASKQAKVVVLDVGDAIDEAAKVVETLRQRAATTKAIVCARGLVPQRMTQLVSAGASDVLAAPAGADVLGKKIWRVVRRGR